ncbi:uncharacterized protein FTJAE_2320 [Fusarium tjaetaba]|uniref:F-box domain-containing protein n=1 Tax=Fusarium tjaetaba TaxID=1567544 RepID=A0A8H5W589_9HYPO|nr:uncharacterized protein FTJAE_2320 [Fusarium tjaetaba]KAF5645890.1 hypothetical protein FTJAE_2320 [Fusarium tjaetaba]
MLASLPPEILENICDKLNGIDLQQLSLTAKWLHKITFRHLWRSITIRPYPESERHCINPSGPPQHCLQYTKELRFDPGVDVDPKRCIHASDWLGYMANWTDKVPLHQYTWEARGDSFGLEGGKLVRVKFECLAQRAVLLLNRFNDGQLESFSWNYTSCIPSEILEVLSLKHPSIQSLRLVTDPFCSRFNRWSRTSDIDLSAFNNLRRLSWKAPMGCHFDTIASLAKANVTHLEELELELQGWSSDRESRESTVIHHEDNPEVWDKIPASTMLARQMFGLEAGTPEAAERTQFPKLRSLKLTRVPLRDENTGMQVAASSINFSALRYLSLRMCAYWMPFLTDIMESQTPLQLKTLEISDFDLNMPHETVTSKAAAITRFIGSFKGLEELFIRICGPTPSLQFWEHVASHGTTLKRFVYHHRLTDQDEELLNSRLRRDSSDLGLSSEDRNRIQHDPSQNPLSRLNLDFIGLTCAPKYLKDILLPFVAKSSLKVLHIRHTGMNSGPSASWVFNHALELKITEGENEGVPIDDTTKAGNSFNADAEENVRLSLEELATAVRERREWGTPPLQQNFRDFANWVFGPDGIKSLEYIVAGDLSHGNSLQYIPRTSSEISLSSAELDSALAVKILSFKEAKR